MIEIRINKKSFQTTTTTSNVEKLSRMTHFVFAFFIVAYLSPVSHHILLFSLNIFHLLFLLFLCSSSNINIEGEHREIETETPDGEGVDCERLKWKYAANNNFINKGIDNLIRNWYRYCLILRSPHWILPFHRLLLGRSAFLVLRQQVSRQDKTRQRNQTGFHFSISFSSLSHHPPNFLIVQTRFPECVKVCVFHWVFVCFLKSFFRWGFILAKFLRKM